MARKVAVEIQLRAVICEFTCIMISGLCKTCLCTLVMGRYFFLAALIYGIGFGAAVECLSAQVIGY